MTPPELRGPHANPLSYVLTTLWELLQHRLLRSDMCPESQRDLQINFTRVKPPTCNATKMCKHKHVRFQANPHNHQSQSRAVIRPAEPRRRANRAAEQAAASTTQVFSGRGGRSVTFAYLLTLKFTERTAELCCSRLISG